MRWTAGRPSIARERAGRATRAGVALTALFASAATGPNPAAAQHLLYVASQEDVTVAVIDTRTNELVETVDLKALGFAETSKAHDTAVEPDGSYWYVSLIAAGKVLKLDRSNRLVGQLDFETPGLLAVDPTNDRLLVGRSMAAVSPPQRIGVVRRSTMEVEEVDVFFQRPHALAVDPQGRRYFSASLGENSMAYATLGSEDVELLHLDGETHVLVQFAVSPDGRWLVGGGQLTGDLLVFDLAAAAPKLVRSVPVGGQPWHPTFAPDGASLWVPNQSAGTVTVVDVASWTIDEVIHHPALVEPHGSAASLDGRYVYVSSRNVAGTYRPAGGGEGRPGTVVVIDAATRDVVRVIEVGRYAAGMATAPVVRSR